MGHCASANREDEDFWDGQIIAGIVARSPPLAIHNDDGVKVRGVAVLADPYAVDLTGRLRHFEASETLSREWGGGGFSIGCLVVRICAHVRILHRWFE